MPLETLRQLAASCKPSSQWFKGISRCLKASQGRGQLQTVSRRPKAPRLRHRVYGWADFGWFKYYFLTLRASLINVIDARVIFGGAEVVC
jgi:hypothetical protein